MRSPGHRALPWIVAAVLLGWWSYGVWPITALEGDDQGVIFGVESMLRPDPLLRPLRYLYEVQPGSYHLLAALSRLSGAPVETTFGWATAGGALLFALVGARFLRELIGIPLGWALVGLLWCQEVTTAACYLNTSALAASTALAAVLLASRSSRPVSWLGAGLGLGFAGWLRADCLLIAPACLGVIYWREHRWSVALLRTAAIAAVALVSVSVFYRLSGLSLAGAMQSYATRPYLVSSWREMRDVAAMLLSPALGLSALVGFGWLLRQRRYALCGVAAGGIIFSVLAYGASLATPKYFYYLVPFALIPALALAQDWAGWIARQPPARARLAGAAVALLALGDLGLGLRTLDDAHRLLTTAPTWLTLAQTRIGARTLAIVVGPGELITNADGFRVRTGQGFAPLCWHREKKRLKAELATIRSIIDRSGDCTLYWSSWLPRQLLFRELLGLGFTPENTSGRDMAVYQGRWRRGAQIARVDFLGYVDSPYQPPGPAPASPTPGETYFLGTYGGKWPITPLSDGLEWRQLSPVAEGLVTLYQRR